LNTATWIPIVTALPFMTMLSLTDQRSHRLPNTKVSILLVVQICVMTVLSIHIHSTTFLRAAITTGLCTFGVYVFFYIISRGQLGMGDVKYSFPLGLIVGWTIPQMWLTAIWLTFASAGLYALISHRGRVQNESTPRRDQRIALGPFMSLGVLLVVSAPILK